MPANRNALIRFKTIDQCLRNRRRKWTLEDLIEKVSEALYEYEGISKGISRRTVQADIQVMRSNKLGYNAPITIIDKKYYTYEDPAYSITNLPLTETDFSRMTEAVEVLKQFKGFTHFNDLSDVVQKLEGHMYASAHNQKKVVDFEKNDQLKGLEYLAAIYEAIINEHAISLRYQSFKARKPNQFVFHPWWLKEFKNRWFAIGVKNDHPEILTLALDRIDELTPDKISLYRKAPDKITPDTYYADVIGVTVSSALRPENVQLLINYKNAPYILTKPLHHSQHIIERTPAGIVIGLRVQLNFELEKEILGFGDAMKVLQPQRLKENIAYRLKQATELYFVDDVLEEQIDRAP